MPGNQPNDFAPWHFSLRTLLVSVFIGALVAAAVARLCTHQRESVPGLVALNVLLLLAGAVLFCSQSSELRTLGLSCWVFLIFVLAVTIGLVSVGPAGGV